MCDNPGDHVKSLWPCVLSILPQAPQSEEVDNVDIAPAVLELLDIDPPEDARGKKILTHGDHRH
jgi:hypothetical protein